MIGFKNLGSIVPENGKIIKDITNQTNIGWLQWRQTGFIFL